MGGDPRIRPVGDAETTEDQRRALEPLGEMSGLNIFRTLAVHPKLLRSWLPFGGRLLQGGTLAPRTRELVILRTAALCGSDYEWGQHVGIAREAGLTDDEILASGSVMRLVGKSLPNASQNEQGWDAWDDEDRSVLDATDGLVLDRAVPDDVWDRLASSGWSDAQLIELTMLAGHYAMLAGMLRSARVQTEAPLPRVGKVEVEV